MLLLGCFSVAIQEIVAPRANLLQDQYRQLLRSRGERPEPGRFWVAEVDRIYSFRRSSRASDNDFPQDLWVYDFTDNGQELQALYRAELGQWDRGRIVFSGQVKRSFLSGGRVENSVASGGELATARDPFKNIRKKPSQLSISETRSRIESSESDVERASFEVALERKWSTVVIPFVIALFTAPFALSLNRTGKAATVGYAVGLLLVFMAVTSVFEQFGLNGSLPAWIAVWAPLALFAVFGIFLLSKVKT
jgi:lipopolysaccharide export LptBFGC system permease protein LptF